jgi:hypothetical protein
MACERDEEIHSDFLAWILDPSESHGFGGSFLSDFFRLVFSKIFANSERSVVYRNVHENDGVPDIVVMSPDFRLVIENKIYSKERPKQTVRYALPYEMAKGINERYFLVYLTPDGKPSESGSFQCISYELISRLLTEFLPKSSEDSYFLIKHFIEHLDLHISNRSK